MPGVRLLRAGRAALCGMSAPRGAVSSRREAHLSAPSPNRFPRPLPARGADLIMSSIPGCSDAAAQVRRLALGVPGAAAGGEGGRVFRSDSPSVFSSMR
jgi:hypothetical protein